MTLDQEGLKIPLLLYISCLMKQEYFLGSPGRVYKSWWSTEFLIDYNKLTLIWLWSRSLLTFLDFCSSILSMFHHWIRETKFSRSDWRYFVIFIVCYKRCVFTLPSECCLNAEKNNSYHRNCRHLYFHPTINKNMIQKNSRLNFIFWLRNQITKKISDSWAFKICNYFLSETSRQKILHFLFGI